MIRGLVWSLPAVQGGPKTCRGSSSSRTVASRALHSSSVVRLLKNKRFRRPVGIPSQSTSDKTLVGLSPSSLSPRNEAHPSANDNLVQDKQKKLSIKVRKSSATRQPTSKNFRRPNAVQRALDEDKVEIPMAKMANPYELPGINKALLGLNAKVAVIGKDNRKNEAVLSVAQQLGLPALDAMSDAVQQKVDFVLVVEPYAQIHLQEIKYLTAEELAKKEAEKTKKETNGKSRQADEEEEDDDDDDFEDEEENDLANKKNSEQGEEASPSVLRTDRVRAIFGRKIWCDFLQGSLNFRRRFGENQKSPMIRAIKSGKEKDLTKIHVMDATAGLAQDAFVIAGMGSRVTLVERNPIMYSLIASGIYQGHRDVEIAKILDRMQAKHQDAIAYMKSLLEPGKESERPDVVYLDPMYPSKKKLGALTKKGMFVTRRLLGPQRDTAELIEAARRVARSHVVLKRPGYAPETEGSSRSYNSRNTRFEIFEPIAGEKS